MYENHFSPIGQIATVLLLIVLAIGAGANIAHGEVPQPRAFVVVLFGFTMFLVAKLSVVGRKKWITFGPRFMSPGMADLYRVGYWFMAVGVLLTFA